MADAGYSHDKKVISQLIKTGKQLPVLPTDPQLLIRIKTLVNRLIANDKAVNKTYLGTKYVYHSAWEHMTHTLIKINQTRIKNWFFVKIM